MIARWTLAGRALARWTLTARALARRPLAGRAIAAGASIRLVARLVPRLVPRSAAALAIGLVHAYQLLLRPVLGSNCRFVPSCSDYALTALRGHGVLRGGSLAGRRILRCNPWMPGGFDPVPCLCRRQRAPAVAGPFRHWIAR